jgi:hypothetical protein
MAAFLLYQLIASQNAAPQNPANAFFDGNKRGSHGDARI